MRRVILSFVLLLCGCADETNCYENNFENITNHTISPDTSTPEGISVDTGGYPINLQMLDERINRIESCIQNLFKNYPLPDAKWKCLKTRFDPQEKLLRKCLVIKIVPPVYSPCSDWQFIGEYAPAEFCLVKGVVPKPECPCRWRTAIQDENVIITPPEETRSNIPPTIPPAPYLWEIGRMMTSCNEVWQSPFSACLSY